jgi:hypothetical protein
VRCGICRFVGLYSSSGIDVKQYKMVTAIMRAMGTAVMTAMGTAVIIDMVAAITVATGADIIH